MKGELSVVARNLDKEYVSERNPVPKRQSHEAKLLRKEILRKELKDYLLVVGPLTENERMELREWIMAGNSIKDNPYMLYDESGWPMDFINGCRVGDDLWERMSDQL